MWGFLQFNLKFFFLIVDILYTLIYTLNYDKRIKGVKLKVNIIKCI